MPLLAPSEPIPVDAHGLGGGASFFIICDHAGRRAPQGLDQLGLPPAAFERHIAYDIGAREVSLGLAARFQAPAILQPYSRLVIDCNRDPARKDAIVEIADGTPVPANQDLSAADRAARVAEIHAPYHAAIAAELDRRQAAGTSTLLLLIHSFTPSLGGKARPWRFGVLHHGRSPFSMEVLEALRREGGDEIGDNQPYAMDEVDYTAPRHAMARGLDYLELEIRQDLIADEAGQARVLDHLTPILSQAALAMAG